MRTIVSFKTQIEHPSNTTAPLWCIAANDIGIAITSVKIPSVTCMTTTIPIHFSESANESEIAWRRAKSQNAIQAMQVPSAKMR